ncbi:MAG: cell wall hydrolase [Pseudomonadota bacterium]|nr:cell wall hydrolase [Pseudomonadota bacterium]
MIMFIKVPSRPDLPAAVLVLALILPLAAWAQPPCLTLGKGGSVQSAVMKADPAAEELLARLVYAESLSTGFADDPLVHQAIAWGVMNRVRLGEASPSLRQRYGSGVAGVIFRKGQFNPAVSPRSRFSGAFLCPDDPGGWRTAVQAARRALAGEGNPFIATPWEQEHGLSLVVNFYYPRSVQARGPVAPWEGSRELGFIGDVRIGGELLDAGRVRFYRLARPPKDIPPRP